MEVICQISNKKDIATLSAVWKKHKGKIGIDWLSTLEWGRVLVPLIPPGKFDPKHDYCIGSSNGAVFIVDKGRLESLWGVEYGENNS